MKHRSTYITRLASLLSCSFALSTLHTTAQAQGINQITFAPEEIGTTVFQFPNLPDGATQPTVGTQPTVADFQHGELVIGAGSIPSQDFDSAFTWWDLSNPRNPSFVSKKRIAHENKPHVIAFWDDRFTMGNQRNNVRIWNYLTRTQVTRYSSEVSPVWWTVQAPYIYRTTNGYITQPNELEILDFSDTSNIQQLNLVDLNQLVGFYIGTTHPFGNLLICSAGQAKGVAILDMSDPANPVLLSSLTTTGDVYTSTVHGTRIYTGERTLGIGVYNFADPENIVAEGMISLPEGGDARYVMVKENIGWCAPNTTKLYKFDALNRTVLDIYDLPAPGADFVYPLGNMVVTGGNLNHNYSALIAADENPDTQGPIVGNVSPANGATGQHTLSRVGLVMSDQIDVTSLNATHFIVRPVGGTALAGMYSTQTGLVNFTPENPLTPNTTYEVIVRAGGIRDVVGNPTREEFYSVFSTGSYIDIDAGLIGHYPLDEVSGTLAADASTGSHEGALNNFSATPWVSGCIGTGALSFDGINDWVNLDNGETYLKSAFNQRSVALWTRVKKTTGIQVLYEEGGGANGFVIRLNGNTLEARVKRESTIFDLSAPFPGAGSEHQITASYKRGESFDLYLDGILVDSTAVDDTRIAPHSDKPALGGNSGIDSFADGSGHYLEGELDDVRIYNRSLDASEALRLYLMKEGLFGHWRFNDSTVNSLGIAEDATLENGATYSPDALEGPKSINLDGINDYADLGNLDLGEQFTLSAWVKIPYANSNQLETILSNSAGGFRSNGFRFFVFGKGQTNEGRIRFETGNSEVGNSASTDLGLFEFDRWNHIAVTVNRTAGTAQIFYNGTDVTVDKTIRKDFRTHADLHLGQMLSSNHSFAGSIDNLHIYNRLLEEDTIQKLSIAYPQLHLTFDNTDQDSSGQGLDLTLRNGAGYSTDAVVGSHALDLDGHNDHGLTESTDLGNEVTLSAWVRIPSGSDSLETILANTRGGVGNGFKLFTYGSLHRNAGRISFEVGNGTINNPAYSNRGVFEYDQWNHIAVTYDRAAGTARILYNRVDVTQSPDIPTDFNTAARLYVGLMSNGIFSLGGQIDELRIYRTIANDSQLAALGAGSPNTAPVILNVTSSSPAQAVGNTVSASVSASDVNENDNLMYRFNFGDGSATTAYSANNTAQHTYSSPGRYIVTATVTDGVFNQTSSFTQIVHHPLTSNKPTKSSTIVYDAQRSRVWAVNPDNGTVTRINTNPSSANYLNKEFERNTGANPQSVALWQEGEEAWVACKDSGEIYRFSLVNGNFIGSLLLGRGYQPVAIAFAPDDSFAYIACQGAEMVLKVNPNTQQVVDFTPLEAAPHALAVSADSSRLFVTRLQSPHNQGEIWELPTANLPNQAPTPLTLAFDQSANTTSSGSGVPNYLLNAAITPDGRQLWIPSKKDNVASDGGLLPNGNNLSFENTTRSIFSSLDIHGNTQEELVDERFDIDDTGLPSAVTFSPYGDILFGAFMTNNKVVAFDAVTKNQLAAQDVGLAPDGLCLSDDGKLLFVHNFLSRSITVLEVESFIAGTSGAMNEVIESPISIVANEELTASVLNGKRIFYNSNDDRMSRDHYMSCVSCHLGGDQDGRIWDFTARGEGLRNTTSLLGRSGTGHGLVHWTGNFDEIQDFELDIVNNFGGSGFINDGENNNQPWPSDSPNPNAGRSNDLDDLAAYVASLNEAPDSPFRQADGTLSAEALAGRRHFESLACATCHSGERFTDSSSDVQNPLLHDVGTWLPTSGKRLGESNTAFETPTLRGVWASAPYLHDGRYPTLESLFDGLKDSGTVHDTASLTTTERNQLVAYLYEIDDNEPAPKAALIQVGEDRWSQSRGWKRVTHGGGFENPIVILSPVTYNGGHGCMPRVRNVGPDSFEYTLEEWEYLDGAHGAHETIHYIVMNAGTYTLDGKQVTAGIMENVTDRLSTQTFPNSFDTAPVVFAQPVTENDPETISTRIRNITTNSFQAIVQEEEASADNGVHGAETLHYLALETGDYPSLEARAGKSPNAITHDFYRVNFGSAIGTGLPFAITGMQTTNGTDPCALRWRESSLTRTGVDLFLQEENSDGTQEIYHISETVGWFVFGTE